MWRQALLLIGLLNLAGCLDLGGGGGGSDAPPRKPPVSEPQPPLPPPQPPEPPLTPEPPPTPEPPLTPPSEPEAEPEQPTPPVEPPSVPPPADSFPEPQAAVIDASLVGEWMALDALVEIAEGAYLSRPGLFAWDRIDPASALLVSVLPASITGAVADLGAGYGYLGCEVLRRCPGVEVIDLYEAEGRALQAAHRNVARAMETRSKPARSEVIWHDVRTGLNRSYDAIVSNPPFHQGVHTSYAATEQLLRDASGHLQPGGELRLVANSFLQYKPLIEQHLGSCQTLADAEGFRIYQASKRG